MDKEKLAIISSFNELCGIASYTKALADGLSKYYDVEILALNVNVLRKGNSKNVTKHIKSLIQQLKKFDCVNIQYEPSLFGSKISRIKRNLFELSKASKKLVVTIHHIHEKRSYPNIKQTIKNILMLNWKNCFNSWMKALNYNRWSCFFEQIMRFFIRKNVPIIVHTQNDSNFIKQNFNYDQVFDHPLSYYHPHTIDMLSKKYTRTEFCEEYNLDTNYTYVGISGFINLYKGYDTAIKALKHLPVHYHLLIFGSQHPSTIKIEEKINDYIESLLSLIHSLELSNRVKFFRTDNDDEFLRALLCCDFNILPYLERNQMASGVAALALETRSNVIFSYNYAFSELAKYAKDAFMMFSIGNHLELANAILRYKKSRFLPHLKNYHQKYNLATNALLYKNLLSQR